MNGVYAYPGPPLSARWRATPADFQVEEMLPFAADGEGQHAWLTVRKIGLNTRDLACRLAELAGVEERDVGYAGLKDRHAVTVQSFTVDLAGRPEPRWQALEPLGMSILQLSRHRRKLRRGTLKGNRFTLRLRDLQGERGALEQRLALIEAQGFPNYFGEQRFGHGGDNLLKAAAFLNGRLRVHDRHLKGLYLSAARSAIFNACLQARVSTQSWRRILAGELVMLAGSRSLFVAAEGALAELQERLEAHDLAPTGPLCGQAKCLPEDEALRFEESLLAGWRGPAPFPENALAWARALAAKGVEAERRPLIAVPANLRSKSWEDGITLDFDLPAGAYATALLSELLHAPEFSIVQ